MRLSDGRGRMKHAERKKYKNDETAPYVTRTRASACYMTLATFRAIPHPAKHSHPKTKSAVRLQKIHLRHHIFGIPNLTKMVRTMN